MTYIVVESVDLSLNRRHAPCPDRPWDVVVSQGFCRKRSNQGDPSDPCPSLVQTIIMIL